LLAPDVAAALDDRAVALVAAHHVAEPGSPGLADAALRRELALAARRLVTLGATAADEMARQIVDELVARGSLARDRDRLRDPARAAGLPAATLAAMDRLEAALAVPAPPGLGEAALAVGCPPEGVRALGAAGRIVKLDADLAWAATTYRDLAGRAIAMAAAGPLSPAAFRDATGTSRRYVLAILEDLDRRGLLRRTDAGHVLGSKAVAAARTKAAGPSGDGVEPASGGDPTGPASNGDGARPA
jgi:selenocysteine-specific elongation factor